MKTLRINILLGFLVGSLVVQAQKPWETLKYPEAGNFKKPAIETFELKNGIKFYLVEDHELPLIELSAVVRAGSCNEPADKIGLAGILGEVMREGGSEKYPAEALNILLENKAADLSTGIGLTSGRVSLSCLKGDFAALLPVLYDIMLHPSIPQEKLDRVTKQFKSGIGRRNDDPQEIAGREFDALIYGKTSPYARYAEYATIDAITREDLLNFHQQHFTGRNLWIGVVGDFDSKEMKKLLQTAFESFPAGQPAKLNLPTVNYNYATTVNLIDKPDVTQSVVYMGHIGGKRQNPDYAALQLFNEILSGGFSGRLFQNVRTDLGLAYAVFGGYQMPALYEGQFFTGVMTKSSTTAQAIDAILVNIRRLQEEPVSEAELAAAKDRILNSLVFRYPNNASVLFEQMNNTYNGLPQDIFDRYIEELKKVTIADVQRVARQYIKPDKLQLLVVGNKAEIGDQLGKYGPVKEIDITIPKPAGNETAAEKGDPVAGKAAFERWQKALLGGKTFSKLVTQGKGTLYIQGNPAPVEVTQEYMAGTGYVTRLNVMGQQIEFSYLNGVGTMAMGGQTQPLPGAMAEQAAHALTFNPFEIAMHPEGATFEKLGEAAFEGNEAIQIRVTKNDFSVTFHLAKDSYLPIGKTYREFNPELGAETEEKEVFLNYQEVSGIMVPHLRKDFSDGEAQQDITVETATIE